MEGLRLTMRAVCLSVVAVGLAVPGSVGQTLPVPPAPTLSNNSTTGGIDVKLTPTRTTNTLYAITIRDDKQHSATVTSTTPNFTIDRTAVLGVLGSLCGDTGYSISQNATSTTAASPAATIITLPDPPTNITGVGGLQKVTVSWTAAPGATSYQLTLSNGMSFTSTATSYVITGLQTATSYNLIMASVNSSGGRGVFSPAVVVRTANVALQ